MDAGCLERFIRKQAAASGEAHVAMQEVIAAGALVAKYHQRANQQRLQHTTSKTETPNPEGSAATTASTISGIESYADRFKQVSMDTPGSSLMADRRDGRSRDFGLGTPVDASGRGSIKSVSTSTRPLRHQDSDTMSSELFHLTVQRHLAVPLEAFLGASEGSGGGHQLQQLQQQGSAASYDFLSRKGSFSSMSDRESPMGHSDQLEASRVDVAESVFDTFADSRGSVRLTDPWTVQFQNRVLAFAQQAAALYMKSTETFLPDVVAIGEVTSAFFSSDSSLMRPATLETLPGSTTNHLVDLGRNILVRIWSSRREGRKFHRAFRSLREAAVEGLLPPSFTTVFSVLFAYRGRVVSVTILPPISSENQCGMPDVAAPASSTGKPSTPLPNAPGSLVGAFEAAWRVSLGCFGLPAPLASSVTAPDNEYSTRSGGGGATFRRRMLSSSDVRSSDSPSILTAPLPLYLGMDGRFYCITLAHMPSSHTAAASPPSPTHAHFTACTANIAPSAPCAAFTSDVLRREELCTQAAIRCLQHETAAAAAAALPASPSQQPHRERNHARAAVKALHTAEASLLAVGVEVASMEGVSEILHTEGCNMSLLGHVLGLLCAAVRAEAGPPPNTPAGHKKHQAHAAAAHGQSAAASRALMPCVLRRLLVSLMSLYVTALAHDCAPPPPTNGSPRPAFTADKDVVSCAERLLVALYGEDDEEEGTAQLPMCTPASGFAASEGMLALMALAETKYQMPNDTFGLALETGGTFSLLSAYTEALQRVGIFYDATLEIIVPSPAPVFLCDSGRKLFRPSKYWTPQKQQVEFDVWGKALRTVHKRPAESSTPAASLGRGGGRLSVVAGGPRAASPMRRSPSPNPSDAFAASESIVEDAAILGNAPGSGGDSSPRVSCPTLSCFTAHIPAVEAANRLLLTAQSKLEGSGNSARAPLTPGSPAGSVASVDGSGLDDAWFHYGKVARWVFAALCSTGRAHRRLAIEALAEFSTLSPAGSRHFRDPQALLVPGDHVDDKGRPVHSAIEVLAAEKRIAVEQVMMLRLALHFHEVIDDDSAPYRPSRHKRNSSVTRVGRRASTTVSVNWCQMALAGTSAAVQQLLRVSHFAATQASTAGLGLLARLKAAPADLAAAKDIRHIGMSSLDTLLLASDVVVDLSNLLPRVTSMVEDEIHFECIATSAKVALSLLLASDTHEFFASNTVASGWGVFKSMGKPVPMATFTSVVLIYASLVHKYGSAQLPPTLTATVNHPFFTRLVHAKQAMMPFYDYIMEYTFRVADIPKYKELFRLLIRLSLPQDLRQQKTVSPSVAAATVDEDNKLLRSLVYWTVAYFADLVQLEKTLEQVLEVVHLLWCVSRRTVLLYRLETALLCLLTSSYFRQRHVLRADADAALHDDVAQGLVGDAEAVAQDLASAMHVVGMAQHYIRRTAALRGDVRMQALDKGDGAGDGRRVSTVPRADGTADELPMLQSTNGLSPLDIVHDKLALLDSDELLTTMRDHVAIGLVHLQQQQRAAPREHHPELLFLDSLKAQLEFALSGRRAQKWVMAGEEEHREDVARQASFSFDLVLNECDIERKILVNALQDRKLRAERGEDDEDDESRRMNLSRTTSMVGPGGVNDSAMGAKSGGGTTSDHGPLQRTKSLAKVSHMAIVMGVSSDAEEMLLRLKTLQAAVRGWCSMRITEARRALCTHEATFGIRERWDLIFEYEQVDILVALARNLQVVTQQQRERATDLRRASLNVRRRSSIMSISDLVQLSSGETENSLKRIMGAQDVLDGAHIIFLRRVSADDSITNLLCSREFDAVRLRLLIAMLVSAVHCTDLPRFAHLTAGECAIRRSGDALLALFASIFLHLDTLCARQKDKHHGKGPQFASRDELVAFGELTRFNVMALFTTLALFLQRCASRDIVGLSGAAAESVSHAAALEALNHHERRKRLLDLMRGASHEAVGPSSIGIGVALALLVSEQLMLELSFRAVLPPACDQLLRQVHLAQATFAGGTEDREELRREMLAIPTDSVHLLDDVRLFLKAFVELGERRAAGASTTGGAASDAARPGTSASPRIPRRRGTTTFEADTAVAPPPASPKSLAELAKQKTFLAALTVSLAASSRTLRDIPRELYQLADRLVLAVEGYLPALTRDLGNAEWNARSLILQSERFAHFDLLQATVGVLSRDQQLMLQETKEPMFRQLLMDNEYRLWAVMMVDAESDYDLIAQRDANRARLAALFIFEADGLRRLLVFQQSDREEMERAESYERSQMGWVFFERTKRPCSPHSAPTTSPARERDAASRSRATLSVVTREEVQRGTVQADEARAFLVVADCRDIDHRNLLVYCDRQRRNEFFEVGFDGDVEEHSNDEAELRAALAALKRTTHRSPTGEMPQQQQQQQRRATALVHKLKGQIASQEMVVRHTIDVAQDAQRDHVLSVMLDERRRDAVLAYDFWLEGTKRAIASLSDEEMLQRRRIARARELHHAELCRDANPDVVALCLASFRFRDAMELKPGPVLDTLNSDEAASRFAIEHALRQSARLIIDLSHRSVGAICANQPIEWQTLCAQQHELMQDEAVGRAAIKADEEEQYFRRSYEFDLEAGPAYDDDGGAPPYRFRCKDGEGDSESGDSEWDPPAERRAGGGGMLLTAAALEEHGRLLERANLVATHVTAVQLTPRPPPALGVSPSPAALRSRAPSAAGGLVSPGADFSWVARAAATLELTSQRDTTSLPRGHFPALAPKAATEDLLAKMLVLPGHARRPSPALSAAVPQPPSRLARDNPTPLLPPPPSPGWRGPDGARSPAVEQRGPPSTASERAHFLPRIFAATQGSSKVQPSARPPVATPTEAVAMEEAVERSMVDDERLAAWTVMALAWSRNLMEAAMLQGKNAWQARRRR